MKKITQVMVVMAVMATLVGCGGGDPSSANNTSQGKRTLLVASPLTANVSSQPIDVVGVFNFSEVVDATTINSQNIRLLDEVGMTVAVNYEITGSVVKVKPVANLRSSVTGYKFSIANVKDMAGNSMLLPFEVTFNTVVTAIAPTIDTIAPSVNFSFLTGQSVYVDSNFTVGFTQDVNQATATNGQIRLFKGIQSIPLVVTMADEKTAIINPDVNLDPNTDYMISTSGVKYVSGLEAAPMTYSFHTGASISPTAASAPTNIQSLVMDFWAEPSAKATFDNVNKVVIGVGTFAYNVNLSKGISIATGKIYRVAFSCTASVPADIEVRLQNGADPYNDYASPIIIPCTGNIVVDLTATVSDVAAVLHLNLGMTAATVTISPKVTVTTLN